jgi:hypothetical protein
MAAISSSTHLTTSEMQIAQQTDSFWNTVTKQRLATLLQYTLGTASVVVGVASLYFGILPLASKAALESTLWLLETTSSIETGVGLIIFGITQFFPEILE